VPRSGPLSRLILPVQSLALVSAYWPWLTQTTRLLAVLDGSNVRPVMVRLAPLAVRTVVMFCGAESVPSALIVNRWISPSNVPA
jgi:hypothetical protein